MLCILSQNKGITQSGEPYLSLDISIYEYQDFPDDFHVRTYIHFMMEDLANPWISPLDALIQSNAMLVKLNASYSPHGIYFINASDNSCNFTNHSFVMVDGNSNFTNPAIYEGIIASLTGPNGLHIFVVSNTSMASGKLGWAFNAPNPFCMLSGQENNIPIALTGVLEHEVGHCLSLMHPEQKHGSGSNIDCPIPNCTAPQCCNDLVADTDPVENIPPTDPFATNFMASVATGAWAQRNSFTPGQVQRMRHYLKQFVAKPFMQDIQVQPQINGFSAFSSDIIVEPGQVLTIPVGQVLEMLVGSSITVMRGAKLVVNGTITGACGKMWKGIVVEGNTGDAQQLPTEQGMVRVNPGAKIEHAEIAINVRKIGEEGTGGGIVELYGAALENNTIGIDFSAYTRSGVLNGAVVTLPNKSYISWSNFKITESYRGAIEIAPLHIKLGKIKDLSIRSSKFLEERATCTNRATGIAAYDGGIKVNYSLFSKLETGIYTDKLTNLSGSIGAWQNRFEGCATGVSAWVTGTGFKVFDNKFNLSSDSDCDASNTSLLGLYATGTTLGITCTGNTFEDTQPNKQGAERTIGTSCVALGAFNNEINNNTFIETRIGNKASGMNAAGELGLAYFCNEHTASETIPANYRFDGAVRPTQGRLTSSGFIAPTGNVFAVALNKIDNQVGDIQYYYYELDPNQDPTTDIQSNGIIPEGQDFVNPECTTGTEPCNPPCDEQVLNDAKGKFFANKNAYDQKKAQLATVNDPAVQRQLKVGMTYHRQEMDASAAQVLHHYEQDSTKTIIDSVLRWTYLIETPDAWTVLAKHYFFERDLLSFDGLWGAIPSYFSLDSETSIHYQRLDSFFSVMRSIPVKYGWQGQLPQSTVGQLRALLTDCDDAAFLAAAMLRRNGELVKVSCKPQVMARNDAQDSKTRVQYLTDQLSIIPNPASSTATLTVGKDLQGARVTLLDALGRAHQVVASPVGDGSLSIATDLLPTGIYIVVVRYTDGIATGKLVVQH